MIEGDHAYFTIQHRRTHESPWLKPEGKLHKSKPDEWHFSSFDAFHKGMTPFDPSSKRLHKYPKESDEAHDVWAHTGNHGWWTFKYAARALKRCIKLDKAGEFDSFSGYRKRKQAIRREFRIVKVQISYDVTPVSVEDIIEVL